MPRVPLGNTLKITVVDQSSGEQFRDVPVWWFRDKTVVHRRINKSTGRATFYELPAGTLSVSVGFDTKRPQESFKVNMPARGIKECEIRVQRMSFIELNPVLLPAGDGSDAQVLNMCTFESMKVVINYLKKSLEASDINSVLKEYAQFTSKETGADLGTIEFNATVRGIAVSDLVAFVNVKFTELFTIMAIEGLRDAIHKDHPVLAGVPGTASADHQVVITGVSADDDTVKYYDPQTSTYRIDKFAYFYDVWEIGGVAE